VELSRGITCDLECSFPEVCKITTFLSGASGDWESELLNWRGGGRKHCSFLQPSQTHQTSPQLKQRQGGGSVAPGEDTSKCCLPVPRRWRETLSKENTV